MNTQSRLLIIETKRYNQGLLNRSRVCSKVKTNHLSYSYRNSRLITTFTTEFYLAIKYIKL